MDVVSLLRSSNNTLHPKRCDMSMAGWETGVERVLLESIIEAFESNDGMVHIWDLHVCVLRL